MTEDEWRQLVETKTPLLKFRGQWMELDRDKMQQMLTFWQQHGGETPQISVQELLQRTATDDEFEVDSGDALAGMLARLRDPSRIEPVGELPGLQARLRNYQSRGVAWLGFLEQLGLGGCLADDMGLGKTMQVIARLVQERESGDPTGPTLLVAPTSVIGNWHKEVARFAPQLRTLIHHGPKRARDTRAFEQALHGVAMVITSYALIRLDHKLFGMVDWQRVVLDEAQNIKNPKAAQTKAVLKLPARNRLALTGTPVENRLTDLWSIFNFINPGYLDTAARFRKRFELPIQRDGGTPRARREAMIETFQDPRSEPSVFVLSLKAGGVGITLTRANHVFHFDRWWNPAVEDQASDRAFRIGQQKKVFVHKFVTLGTLEERINDMIEDKKALAGAIVGNDESWLTRLDNERFKALIRLNRDEVVD